MNFKHLKYFVATAETGQVSRAAKALSISQSAVTSAVRELEAILGAALFVRTAQGMEITDQGREFLASAREILEKIEAAQNLQPRHSEVSGVISLAATYTVLGYFLPYHLDRISQLYPGIEIKIHEMNRHSIEEELLTSRIDMAVVLTSNIESPDIETQTLLRSPRRLWVPAGHPFSKAQKTPLREIAKQPYIMLTVDEAAHSAMKYWNANNQQPNVKLRTSSVEAVRSLVANAQGVTILSDMVYRPWSLEGRRIETVATDIEIPTMDVGLATRKSSTLSPPAMTVQDYFTNAFLSPRYQP
ncbi:transcriptional regulator [Hoeflea sp. IMCC20628]|uniref:LysR family transcriptional regulator n=1 Tax=Hoeflea sp. IMCC20628 TaxID=1620421 RepID=UPI00063AB940|nr:LysR family transcriptional regulator [Hoeflea sp. IMCC20628]AKH98744.1 transcriptional regulator [Hoeflea sp. IMCC20628]